MLIKKPFKKGFGSSSAAYYSGGIVGPPVLTFLGTEQASSSAQTQPGAAISSTAAARRMVILAWSNTGGQTVTSGTITPNVGTAQSLIIVQNYTNTTDVTLGIAYAVLASDADTATTLTPSITFAANPFVAAIFHMWSAPSAGVASLTPTGSNHTVAASATNQTTTVATTAAGFVIVVSCNNGSNTGTISGTEAFTTTNFGTISCSANNNGVISTNASSNVTATYTGAASDMAVAAAAWR